MDGGRRGAVKPFRIASGWSDGRPREGVRDVYCCSSPRGTLPSGVEVGFLSDRRGQGKAEHCPSKHNKHHTHTLTNTSPPWRPTHEMRTNIIKEQSEGELG